MLTKQIEWNGATITLRRAKIRDRLLMNSIIGKLGIDATDTGDFAGKRLFARLITQAQIEGDGLGFALPANADSEEDLRVGFAKFLDLDGELYDSLEEALHEVDRSLNDPDLLPAEIVPENLDEAAE